MTEITKDKHNWKLSVQSKKKGVEISVDISLAQRVPAGWESHPDKLVVLAHGAGQPRNSEFMEGMAQALTEKGWWVVLFNFVYMEYGPRMPERQPALQKTYREVLAHLQQRFADLAYPPKRWFIGGKSMGGRTASHLAEDPELAKPLAGVVYLGYPLVPPAKPDQIRADHLPNIQIPQLFMQGSKDPFSPAGSLEAVLPNIPKATHMLVPGGEHSFKRPKRDGVSLEDTLASVANDITLWADALEGS